MDLGLAKRKATFWGSPNFETKGRSGAALEELEGPVDFSLGGKHAHLAFKKPFDILRMLVQLDFGPEINTHANMSEDRPTPP